MDTLDILCASVASLPSYKLEQMYVLAKLGSVRYPFHTPQSTLSPVLGKKIRKALKQLETEPLTGLIELRNSINLKSWIRIKQTSSKYTIYFGVGHVFVSCLLW